MNEARTWDDARARERMRALRAEGSTVFDWARNDATRRLIDAHREEFDGYRRDYVRQSIEAESDG